MGHIAKKSKPSAPAAKASKAIPVAIVTAVDTDSDSSSESSSDEGESDSESEAEVAIAKSQVKGQAEESSEEENSDSSEEESDEDDSDDEEEEVTNLLTLTTTTTATVVQGEEDEEVGGEPKLKMGRIERRKRAEKAVAEDQEKAIAASLVVLPDMEAPPKGYPTALEAVTNTIVTLGAAGAEGKVALLCVICPTKKLQEGTMLEVHLKGKDHIRRLARYSNHVNSAKFPAKDLAMDARTVSTRLDAAVLAKAAPLIAPNDPTIPLLAKTLKRTREDKALPPSTDQSPEAIAKRAAAEKRRASKAMLIAVRAKKMVVKRASRKEKFERIKNRKVEKLNGVGVTDEQKATKAAAKALKKANKAKKTPEQIAAKLALSKARVERFAKKRLAMNEKKAAKKAARAPAPGSKPKPKQLVTHSRGKKDKADAPKVKKQK